MGITLKDWLARAVATLADSPSARLDADLLAMHVTGLTRAQLITTDTQTLSPAQADRLDALLARRARGEPVAYLIGHCEFWSLPLTTTPATLVPRPETEHLVEQALARIPDEASFVVVDLGTGSGAVALAIAKERSACRVVGIDRSQAALDVARQNQTALALSNVEWRQGDWCTPLLEPVDIVVSNPPYVANGDPHLLGDGVRFEPREALQAGPDGLDAIRRIAFCARSRLRPSGWLVLEHGHEQREAVHSILSHAGYTEIQHYRDYGGNDRVSAGQWCS